MKILGIMWEENSTAALVVDGEVVACVSEERFSRAKNDERYPKKAIEYVLQAGGITAQELDLVTFATNVWKPYYVLTRRYSTSKMEDHILEQTDYWYPRFYQKKKPRYFDVFKHKIDEQQYPGDWKRVRAFIKKDDEGVKLPETVSAKFFQNFRREVVAKHLKIDPKKIVFTDHHEGHAYYAYFASPLRDNTIIITGDAWGDDINATVSTVKKGTIKRISLTRDFILGRLYRYITLLLGMKPNEHEYKVMGLAPYAKESYYQDVLSVFKNTQRAVGLTFKYKFRPPDLYFYFQKQFVGKRFDAIAGALQKYTEELLVSWVRNILAKTKLRKIVFAGGTAMNIKANMEINKLPGVQQLFVAPTPSDESQAIGAAYVGMYAYCKKNGINPDRAIKPLTHAYLGPAITNEEVTATLKKHAVRSTYKVTDAASPEAIAKLLVAGKVVGRAAGRSEFGARALGNRSIIADPRNFDIIKVINDKIKNRDFWMPFAASILEKRAADYLHGYKACGAPYMTMGFETTPLAAAHLKAGLHPADLTCRPQVLQPGQNPGYEKILLAFEKLTGVGGVLNTSFNLHGEPIVQTAEDAWRVFQLSDIDAIVLNDTLIEKISKS